MKRTIISTIAAYIVGAVVALTTLGYGAITTNIPPADAYASAYNGIIETEAALIGLQDSVPGVAILACPNAEAVATNFVYTVPTGTNVYMATGTNIVQASAYRPLSWDTTTWPIANAAGVKHRIAIVTGGPTVTFATFVSSGQVATVIATVTTNAGGLFTGYTVANVTNAAVVKATSIPVSNIWGNTDGTTNGWILIQ